MGDFSDRMDALFSDPERVVQGCKNLIGDGEPKGLSEGLADMGAPVRELIPTPISARVAVMAHNAGSAFFHHELRGYMPMPPELEPEVPVWDGQTTPVWAGGVRQEPKYFSFFTDSVLAPYNPNTRSKWRVHELLHGLVGFYWHPKMTRFAMYAGARLSELLPVVHWYGTDEVFRPRCEAHQGRLLYRQQCRRCEELIAPYWQTLIDDAQINNAHKAMSHAQEHLFSELQACHEEIETGRQVLTHRPRLDSSNDAIGYMKGHWPRLTAWSFGQYVERFLVPSHDYYDDLWGLFSRVQRVWQAMVSEDVALCGDWRRRRVRRVLQDLGYRSLLALEWLDPSSENGKEAERIMLPCLDELSELASDLIDDDAVVPQAMQAAQRALEMFALVSDRFPNGVAEPFGALGHHGWSEISVNQESSLQLCGGLQSGFPMALGDRDVQDLARAFLDSRAFEGPESLHVRFSRWDGLPVAVAETLRVEGWIHAEPHRDDEAELFGVSVGEHPVDPDHVRLNTTFRRRRVPAAIVAECLDQAAASLPFVDDDDHVELCAVWWRGQSRVIPLDSQSVKIIEDVMSSRSVASDDLSDLIDAGIAVYLPVPAAVMQRH